MQLRRGNAKNSRATVARVSLHQLRVRTTDTVVVVAAGNSPPHAIRFDALVPP